MATKTKAPADYGKLASQAELERDGFASRVERSMAEITKLLGDFKDRERVKQLISHYAVQRAYQVAADEKLARYVSLRDGSR